MKDQWDTMEDVAALGEAQGSVLNGVGRLGELSSKELEARRYLLSQRAKIKADLKKPGSTRPPRCL
jgi:hypothetical protein